jgi:predicted enzyme related to lactoylglutathione lyase
MKSALFPADLQNGIGGCLLQGKGYELRKRIKIVYLNGYKDLSAVLSKVEADGGKVTLQKTPIGGNEFMAHCTDTEDNK